MIETYRQLTWKKRAYFGPLGAVIYEQCSKKRLDNIAKNVPILLMYPITYENLMNFIYTDCA
jgi:hypothetical protein